MSYELVISQFPKGRNGSRVLLRDGKELYCPFSSSGHFCGDWCPHFIISDSLSIELMCVVGSTIKVKAKKGK